MPWYAEWLIFYLVIINIIGAIVTVHDKIMAKRSKWRVSEKTLFILASIGSGVSVYVTMLLIRHKTRHKRFMIGIPLIIITEILLIMAITILVRTNG